jgi:hypothetical protein
VSPGPGAVGRPSAGPGRMPPVDGSTAGIVLCLSAEMRRLFHAAPALAVSGCGTLSHARAFADDEQFMMTSARTARRHAGLQPVRRRQDHKAVARWP